MTVNTQRIKIQSQPDSMVDITDRVQDAISKSNLKNGTVTIFVSGSTASVSTIEYEDGAISDCFRALELISPKDQEYKHHLKWHDDNGRSHVRACLLGPSLTVPFENTELTLGTWQQIVLIELDTSDRSRELVLQIIGE